MGFGGDRVCGQGAAAGAFVLRGVELDSRAVAALDEPAASLLVLGIRAGVGNFGGVKPSRAR